MEVFDYILWGLTETIKYVLISYGILGYNFKKRNYKWMIIFFCFLFIGIIQHLQLDVLFLKTVYGYIIILACFNGKFLKKIQSFLLQYIAITAIDLLIWSIFVNISGSYIYVNSDIEYYIKWVSEILGCVFWGIVFMLLKKQRKKIKEIFENLSFLYFVMVFAVLTGLAFMVGVAHFNLLEKVNNRMQEVYLTVSSIVLVLFIVLAFVFMYLIYSKKQLEVENKFTFKCIELQKSYYEKLIDIDEDLRRFKHDINKHIGALNTLCNSNNVKALKEYVNNMGMKYVENTLIQVNTGNLIADYFINQTIIDLKKDGDVKFELIGRFPQELKVSNSDLCILFGNAMENALEALKKVKEDRNLVVVIKNIHNYLFLSIANSVSDADNINFETTKRNKRCHGYGIGNMIKVIKSYNGEIQFYIKNNMFVVDMEIW